MLEPQIFRMNTLHVVGLRSSFIHGLSEESNAGDVISSLWDQMKDRHSEIKGRSGADYFGVIYGLPEEERSHPDELMYIAGVAVKEFGKVPEGMVRYEVPEATFAIFTNYGTWELVRRTVKYIYREWIPQSQFAHSMLADIEIYETPGQLDSDSMWQYCISIKQK